MREKGKERSFGSRGTGKSDRSGNAVMLSICLIGTLYVTYVGWTNFRGETTKLTPQPNFDMTVAQNAAMFDATLRGFRKMSEMRERDTAELADRLEDGRRYVFAQPRPEKKVRVVMSPTAVERPKQAARDIYAEYDPSKLLSVVGVMSGNGEARAVVTMDRGKPEQKKIGDVLEFPEGRTYSIRRIDTEGIVVQGGSYVWRIRPRSGKIGGSIRETEKLGVLVSAPGMESEGGRTEPAAGRKRSAKKQ